MIFTTKWNDFKKAQIEYNEIGTSHIGVLDGIRAIAIFIVLWFHYWQASWLMPIIQTPKLQFLGINAINLDWIPRTGYEMVDMMLLLSGFCLFLPHAKHMILGTPLPNTSSFYKKRAVRILPSYWLCIFFLLLVFNLPEHVYETTKDMWKDLLPHLTFTHTYFPESYLFTRLNGVLWTLAVEVQFYILFPFIAKAFRKKTLLTYFTMTGFSWAFINMYVIPHHNQDLSMWINQLPTFFGVYANGMLAALIFVAVAHFLNQMTHKEKSYIFLLFTVISVLCIFMYWKLMSELSTLPNGQQWQIENRYFLSLLYAVFIISCCFSIKAFRFLFANKLAAFLSAISLQVYIWHTLISDKLKQYHIPFWEGDTPPNQSGDKVWQWKYLLLCIGVTLLVGTVVTFLFEKPITKFFCSPKSPLKKEDISKDISKNIPKE